ncbi:MULTISPECIES: glucose-6-phosphate isomerase [unclassified Caballeronia]|uniref:glucose-6-phosphate isomerase n=1 Tax=unclassified Caballeronia TaxID=2646786 RepID=UPI0028668363|nr:MULTISPECIES: glucose-6-phosphate isomerase [unclassified Caballeronia]MDR5818322.1 glucose-6-phosphate isomerase [Caballeronia sp. LZ033]MDR5825289.1 glucose-6-phosphate isomerase [Caballeronia sp. LZ043]
MSWPEPRAFDVDLETGLMDGTDTRYRKHLRDLDGLYADAAAFAALAAQRGDDVVYDVTDHRPSAAPGDLITGVTRMSPGKVGNEYFMTRGHIHANIDRPELYFGLKGTGLMLMESPDGDTRIIEIRANTVCYVPPRWIHRSVNFGGEDFVMLFCYPADSGQDYAIIEKSNGMKLRVVDDGAGGYRTEPNPAYVARSGADIDQLIERASEGATR